MSAEQSPATEPQRVEEAPYGQQQTAAHEPIDARDEWLEEPEQLPRRPRRRLLSPAPVALLAVLLIACGFIAGVLVEKGQSSSSSSSSGAAGASSGLAARFAALRAGATGSGGAASTSAAGGAAASGFGGAGFGGAGGATVGQVAYSSNGTLYITNTSGNTVKVKTSPATTVSKTVTSSVKAIHPGETVTVTGSAGANGAVSAESIRVGAGGAGGLAGLFGGSAGGTSTATGAGGGTGGAKQASEPALFGSG